MPKEYKKMVCIINNLDCNDANTCNDCYIAIEERQREQEEADVLYMLDLPCKIGGRSYFGNKRNTVIKTHVDEIGFLMQFLEFREPKEISREEYLWNVAKYYPEWEKTKEILEIKDNPDKILFEKNKYLIVIFGNLIYVIAPKLEMN